MNPAWIPVFAFGGPLVVFGGFFYLVHRHERNRVDAMRAVARTMGFSFEDTLGDRAPERFGELPLFARGRRRHADSVMAGTLAGEPAVAFDYSYVVGSGKNNRTFKQTVALFPTKDRALPDFELAPENFLHKLGQVFGYQDLDFQENEEFSRRYLLRGADEDAIRRAFNATVLAFLAGRPGWSVQTRAGTAAVFRAGTRCKPDQLPAFLADALLILSGLGAGTRA